MRPWIAWRGSGNLARSGFTSRLDVVECGRVFAVRVSEEFLKTFGRVLDCRSSFLRRLLSSVRRVSSLLVVGALLSTTDAVRDVLCVSRRLLLVYKTCLPIFKVCLSFYHRGSVYRQNFDHNFIE